MTDQASAELLPCPFCGCEPAVKEEGVPRIYCAGDECMGPRTTAFTMQDATVQWNTRMFVPAASKETSKTAVFGPTLEDRMAFAIMMDDSCGLTINGQRVLCDDPRALEKPDRCFCRKSAQAALAVLPGPALQEIEQLRAQVERAAAWHQIVDKQPDVGRKFICLWNDGSGAVMYWRHDHGYIDHDGDECSEVDWTKIDRWAYLPDNLEFWCEIAGDDPMTLSHPSTERA